MDPWNQLRRKYHRVYRSLGRAELQRGADEIDALDLDALFDPVEGLWLGFYTREGLHIALERYGFFDDIRELGYEDFEVVTRADDPEEHMLKVMSRRPRLEEPLVELVTRRTYLNLTGEVGDRFDETIHPVLSIEWLQLQNPLRDFEPERPPLPGQVLPGLGLGKNIFELLRNVCKRLDLAALVTTPSYLHNALLYDEGFNFFDPDYQGQLEALRRDLFGALLRDAPALAATPALATLSWAMCWGMVLERDAEPPFEWFHEPMVAPISKRLARYLESDWYKEEREHALARHHFELLLEPLEGMLARRGIEPFDRALIEEWIHEDRP